MSGRCVPPPAWGRHSIGYQHHHVQDAHAPGTKAAVRRTARQPRLENRGKNVGHRNTDAPDATNQRRRTVRNHHDHHDHHRSTIPRCRHRPRALRRSSEVSPSGLPTGRSGSREPPRRPTSTAAWPGTVDLTPSVSVPSRALWPGTVPPSSSTPAGPCSVLPASLPRRLSTRSSGGTWWMRRYRHI